MSEDEDEGSDFFESLSKWALGEIKEGIPPMVQFSKDVLIEMAHTKEGVGFIMIILGMALKTLNFKLTIDLFPIDVTKVIQDPDVPITTTVDDILAGNEWLKNLPFFELIVQRVIDLQKALQKEPVTAEIKREVRKQEFGSVYLYDFLTWAGMGIMGMGSLSGLLSRP